MKEVYLFSQIMSKTLKTNFLRFFNLNWLRVKGLITLILLSIHNFHSDILIKNLDTQTKGDEKTTCELNTVNFTHFNINMIFFYTFDESMFAM